MKIAVLGFGVEGRAAYEYWAKDGHELTVHDQDESVQLPAGARSRLGKDYLKNLGDYDLLVRTPFLRPQNIVATNPETLDILHKVTTGTNEFLRVSPSKNIIGVTGTKGKGTTCTLIAKMLEAAGKRVHLGGNIGTPALELLRHNVRSEDWVVLELSSFQLIDLAVSPPLAVCLMVAPEHMNWHPDMEEYIIAKQQLFRRQREPDTAIYFADNEYSEKIVSVSKAIKIPYYKSPGAEVVNQQIIIDGQTVCGVKDIKLLGKHNWQNACAAVTAVWQVTRNAGAMRSVLQSFSGLEHRLQFVRELDNVRYYDDSFATTPDPAIVALEAFQEPKVIILGGSDKGATYEQLAETVMDNNVRAAVVIGDTGPAIAEALRSQDFKAIVPGGNTMRQIVETARAHAQPGDVVLLSTACASFGLFKNYKDRGIQFTQVARGLV